MSNTKISQLPATATLVGDEILPIVQGGVSKKITVEQITADIVLDISDIFETIGNIDDALAVINGGTP